jgi:hypothetical protein
MHFNTTSYCWLGLATLVAAPAAAQAQFSLTPLDSYLGPDPSSEIMAHDRFNGLLYNTFGGGVELVGFSNPANLSQVGTVPMATMDNLELRSVSSVAADPLGRGFGVATFIPKNAGTDAGRVVFFDPVAKTVLHSVAVGYHPDHIQFSPDGKKLFVANEGEPISEGANHFDRPGSISVVDLSSVTSKSDVAGLGASSVGTYDFSSANLAPGVSLSGLRIHPSNRTAGTLVNDIEPEFIASAGDKLFVTLQENNGVGVFDLAQQKWTAVHSLGTIQQTIDASSNDGGANINDVVHGLPMPDGLASMTKYGKTYFMTANEGDARPADNVAGGHPNGASDEARFQQLGSGGRPALDPAVDTVLDAAYGGNAQADSALGRLRISLIDGNLDADPEIERPTMFGTRSFSIWNGQTGELVWDSGSDFETITKDRVPSLYNSNGAGPADTRSQNKGPEPEGIVLGEAYGRTFAFIGLERTGGVMVYDVTNPKNGQFVDYINTGELAPEGLDFIPASESPTGVPLLVAGFEVSNQIGVFQLNRTAVPEGGALTWTALGSILALGLLKRRESRK